MLYFAQPNWTHFLLIEFPSPNKSSSAGKIKFDTKTSHYLDKIIICINLILASIKGRQAWLIFSPTMYILMMLYTPK